MAVVLLAVSFSGLLWETWGLCRAGVVRFLSLSVSPISAKPSQQHGRPFRAFALVSRPPVFSVPLCLGGEKSALLRFARFGEADPTKLTTLSRFRTGIPSPDLGPSRREPSRTACVLNTVRRCARIAGASTSGSAPRATTPRPFFENSVRKTSIAAAFRAGRDPVLTRANRLDECSISAD
jgi:hypothetical protein